MDDSTQVLAETTEDFIMRYLTTQEMLSEQIDFRNICVFPIREALGLENIFENTQRYCNVFFLYIAGRREYRTQDGTTFYLNPGEILYVPQYATYRFRILEAQSDLRDEAIAVNFEMTDMNGENVCFAHTPTVLLQDATARYLPRFSYIESLDTGEKNRIMPLKAAAYSLCYDILSEVLGRESAYAPWKDIQPAIDLIEAHPAQDLPIPELARQCGVSQTRFRQLFRMYTGGLSPIQYRNRLRIEQVTRMLRTEQVTVEYAAREAGFHDMSHFYRMFKKFTDTSD